MGMGDDSSVEGKTGAHQIGGGKGKRGNDGNIS